MTFGKLTLSLLGLLCYAVSYGQSSSVNSDFELGDFTGWQAKSGEIHRHSGEVEFYSTRFKDHIHRIITDNYIDRYTCGNMPSIPPDGGTAVAKLGNNINGRGAEQLSYTMTVDETNALFIYKYAVVFENPDHDHDEQPFFELAVTDLNGDIIDPVCGYVRVVSGDGSEGFNTCEIWRDPFDSDNDTIIRWKPWTTVAMDLTPYMGQTIKLEFTNVDCRLGGHWGYAYMEATTTDMSVEMRACSFDSTAYLAAPRGFASYEWSNGETTREIYVKDPQEGARYTVTVATSPDCTLEMEAIIDIDTIEMAPQEITICKGQPAVLTSSSANYYEWSHGLGTGDRKVVYPEETTAYVVTGTTDNGCVDVDTSFVTVHDAPPVDIQGNNPCAGDSVKLSTPTNGFASYSWQGPNGFQSADQNPTIADATSLMSGSYLLYAEATNGCVSDTSIIVEVIPSPSAVITATNACEGGDITIRSFLDGAVSYEWHGPNAYTSSDQNLLFMDVDASINGEYSIVAVNQFGCTDSASTIIDVHPTPLARFSNDTVCAGEAVTFVNTSVGATAYDWNLGNGTYSQDETPMPSIYSGAFAHDIRLTVFNEFLCSHDTVVSITPYSTPEALFRAQPACVGDAFRVEDHSYVFNDTIDNHFWNITGIGTTTLSSPEFVITDTLPIAISLTVSTENCSSTMRDTLYPRNKPTAVLSDTSGCSPLPIAFDAPSYDRAIYNWDFGDGEISYAEDPMHYFFNDADTIQSFTVQQVIVNEAGCSDTTSATVSVMPGSKADFTFDPPYVCSGQPISFTNASLNADSIEWLIDDTLYPNIEVPTHIYYNEGETTLHKPVRLTSWSAFGCADSITKYISVYPYPTKGIDLSANPACSPAIITLSTESEAANYEWEFGDGTFEIGGSEIEHVYINEGTTTETYTVKLTVATNSECSAEFTSLISIHPSPYAHFSIDTNIACSPYTAHIKNESQGAISNTWMIDSVQQTYTPEFDVFLENKDTIQHSYRIQLGVENAFGCTDQHALSVNVFPEVEALFVPDPVLGCSPLDVSFTNKSTGADSYYWSYGDETHSSNVHSEHTYINSSDTVQSYEAFLVAISPYNCTDTSDVEVITVNPSPRALFSVDTISGCSPKTVTITNESEGATMFDWDYGNGNTNTGLPQEQIYSNTEAKHIVYHITLTAENDYACIDTAIQPITIFPQPVPEFEPLENGCSPLPITFENTSKNADLYVWDFGDGKMSTVESPLNAFVHKGLTDTTFYVTLKAITHLGCEAEYSEPVTVYATPYPSFTPSASLVLFPETTVLFENKTLGDWDFDWDLGDGTTSKDPDVVVHTYLDKGEFPVVLFAEGEHCKDSVIHTIVVDGSQIIAAFDSSVAGCSPVHVQFENKSFNAVEFYWDLGDGTVSNDEHPSHTYEEPGTYVVELTVKNEDLVDIARSHTVTVYENPRADFEIKPDAVSLPDAVINTYNKSDNANKVWWDFGNGETSTDFQPQFEYEGQGVYPITLMIESRDGCRDTLSILDAVTVLDDCTIKFPNAFTPTTPSGGHYDIEAPEVDNDIFHPLSLNIDEYKLQIFNRWGEIVFETFHIDQGWDGFYRGEMAKSDVYVWKCEATCIGGSTFEDMGTVTLLR